MAKVITSQPYVLVCDDDEGILDISKIILEELGFLVKIINHSEKIFEAISQRQPDVLVLDLWMPGLSGKDIARKIKSNPITAGIPIIIVSASKDTAQVAFDVGADDVIFKPFDIAEFENKVMAALKKNQT